MMTDAVRILKQDTGSLLEDFVGASAIFVMVMAALYLPSAL